MKGSAPRLRTRLIAALAIAFIPLVLLEVYLLQEPDERPLALFLAGAALAVAFASAIYVTSRLERIYRDVERARADVEAERRRLGEVVNELPVAVSMYDSDGRALLRNAAYFRLLGGTPPETLDEAVRFYQTRREDGTVIPPGELPQQRALRGEVVRSEALRLRHAETGEDVHVLVDAVPLAREGEPPIALVVIHDITKLRKTEQERTQFFEMASHEIKTPLTVLVGSVELARRFFQRGAIERLDDVLARADEGGRRLSDLVRELLDLTRLDAGKLDLHREPIDLVGAIRTLVDETRVGAERHEITFEGPSDPVRVSTDPRRIAQVIQNLLDNALRYSPEGGRIEVTVRLEGRDAVVRVTDHGIGIPEQERHELFQRFFRTSRSRQYAGTGLGLFISKRIAEAHGGRLWLESTSPHGSTFALALPALRAAGK